jgi:hypothetical protein
MKISRIGVIVLAGAALMGAWIFAMQMARKDREPVFADDPPKWPPGSILLAYEAGLAEHKEAILTAAAEFNRQVDCPVWSITTPGNAKALLKWLDTESCKDRGKPLDRRHTEGMWDCKDGTVEAQFDDLADPETRYPLIFHALGHMAGLTHDTEGGLSVMLDPPPKMVAGKLAPGLTSKDAQALRERFCP